MCTGGLPAAEFSKFPMRRSFLNRGFRRASRIALEPFRRANWPIGENDSRIKALKDIHAGKRAFVIGNGPSLKVADLDRLKGEVTFACNKVYLAFEQTDWRPTYYSVSDELVAHNNREAISGLPLTKILSDCVQQYFDLSDASVWVRELSVKGSSEAGDDGTETERGPEEEAVSHPFSDNLLVGFYGGGTVTYQMLQIAYYMGITEVILIGIDFSFQVPKEVTKSGILPPKYDSALKSEGEVNHFHPDYRKPGELWGMPTLAPQIRSYRAALKHFQAAGRTVVNASRQTKLEVFPRANLDEILSGPR
jgi:hypothetical protein